MFNLSAFELFFHKHWLLFLISIFAFYLNWLWQTSKSLNQLFGFSLLLLGLIICTLFTLKFDLYAFLLALSEPIVFIFLWTLSLKLSYSHTRLTLSIFPNIIMCILLIPISYSHISTYAYINIAHLTFISSSVYLIFCGFFELFIELTYLLVGLLLILTFLLGLGLFNEPISKLGSTGFVCQQQVKSRQLKTTPSFYTNSRKSGF